MCGGVGMVIFVLVISKASICRVDDGNCEGSRYCWWWSRVEVLPIVVIGSF